MEREAAVPQFPAVLTKFNPRAIVLPDDLLPPLGAPSATYRGESAAEQVVAPGDKLFSQLGKLMPLYARSKDYTYDADNNPVQTDIGYSKIPWTIPWSTDTARFVGGLWLYKFCLQYASMQRAADSADPQKLGTFLNNQFSYFDLVHRPYAATIEQRMLVWLKDVIVQGRQSPKALGLLDRQLKEYARVFHKPGDYEAFAKTAQQLQNQNDMLREKLAEHDIKIEGMDVDVDTGKQTAAAKMQILKDEAARHRQSSFRLLIPNNFVIDVMVRLRDLPFGGRAVPTTTAPASARSLRPIVPSNAVIDFMCRLRDMPFGRGSGAAVVQPKARRLMPIVPSNAAIDLLVKMRDAPLPPEPFTMVDDDDEEQDQGPPPPIVDSQTLQLIAGMGTMWPSAEFFTNMGLNV